MNDESFPFAVPVLTSVLSLFAVGACTSAAPASPETAAELDRDVAPGFFSAKQVDRGRLSFRESCDECHASSEFQGSDFEWRWRRQSAWDLYREISSNMPENDPGSLSPEANADIVAYLLSVNDYQMGGQDLAATQEAMREIPLGAGVAKTKAGPATTTESPSRTGENRPRTLRSH